MHELKSRYKNVHIGIPCMKSLENDHYSRSKVTILQKFCIIWMDGERDGSWHTSFIRFGPVRGHDMDVPEVNESLVSNTRKREFDKGGGISVSDSFF